MEVNNSGAVRFSLAWRCLLATVVLVAVISCRGARAASEAGNTTILRRCHGDECLIAYQQPEVELMAVLDPELAVRFGAAVGSSKNKDKPADFCRTGPGRRYTPCVPGKNPPPRNNPYPRKVA